MSTTRAKTALDTIRRVAYHPAFLIGFLILVIISYLQFDQLIALSFSQSQTDTLVYILKVITEVGRFEWYVVGLPILMAIAYLLIRSQSMAQKLLFVWVCVMTGSVCAAVLKHLIGRARPPLFLEEGIYGIFGPTYKWAYWSFPSGHTTILMTVAFALSYLYPKRAYLWVAVGFLLSLTRIVVLKHYLSDVLLSAYLAFVEVMIVAWVYERFTAKNTRA